MQSKKSWLIYWQNKRIYFINKMLNLWSDNFLSLSYWLKNYDHKWNLKIFQINYRYNIMDLLTVNYASSIDYWKLDRLQSHKSSQLQKLRSYTKSIFNFLNQTDSILVCRRHCWSRHRARTTCRMYYWNTCYNHSYNYYNVF